MLRFKSGLNPHSVLIWNCKDRRPFPLYSFFGWRVQGVFLLLTESQPAPSKTVKLVRLSERQSDCQMVTSVEKCWPEAPPSNRTRLGMVEMGLCVWPWERPEDRLSLLYLIQKMSCGCFESPKWIRGLSHLHLFKLEPFFFFSKGKIWNWTWISLLSMKDIDMDFQRF